MLYHLSFNDCYIFHLTMLIIKTSFILLYLSNVSLIFHYSSLMTLTSLCLLLSDMIASSSLGLTSSRNFPKKLNVKFWLSHGLNSFGDQRKGSFKIINTCTVIFFTICQAYIFNLKPNSNHRVHCK